MTLPYIAVSPKAPTAGLDAIIDRLTPYMDSRDTNETSFITPFKSPNPDVHPLFLSSDINVSHWETIPHYIYSGYKPKLSNKTNGTSPSSPAPGSPSAQNSNQTQHLIPSPPSPSTCPPTPSSPPSNQNTTSPPSSTTKNTLPPTSHRLTCRLYPH